jgi:hypothetical protein
VVAILLGGLLALFSTAGPAVGFFSAGLFLDVQVESPARLLARGAAIEVPLEVTCSGTGTVDLFVSVSQRSGSGVAEGGAFESVPCSGSGEQVTVTVQATGGKVFKKGTAVVTAEIFGCNEAVCGSETDTEVIEIQR